MVDKVSAVRIDRPKEGTLRARTSTHLLGPVQAPSPVRLLHLVEYRRKSH